MSDTFVAFKKNEQEDVRVFRQDFKGHDLVHVRVFYRTPDGDMRPTQKGIAINAALLPDLIDALQSLAE